MRNNMVDMTIIALSFELWQMLQSKNKKSAVESKYARYSWHHSDVLH